MLLEHKVGGAGYSSGTRIGFRGKLRVSVRRGFNLLGEGVREPRRVKIKVKKVQKKLPQAQGGPLDPLKEGDL